MEFIGHFCCSSILDVALPKTLPTLGSTVHLKLIFTCCVRVKEIFSVVLGIEPRPFHVLSEGTIIKLHSRSKIFFPCMDNRLSSECVESSSSREVGGRNLEAGAWWGQGRGSLRSAASWLDPHTLPARSWYPEVVPLTMVGALPRYPPRKGPQAFKRPIWWGLVSTEKKKKVLKWL